MCYDLNEYDPFEPYWEDDYSFASYPMEEYNWEEWLDSEPMTVDDWDSWLYTTMETNK